jgi:CPA2 family monovalent cation:H+ antiporter-2
VLRTHNEEEANLLAAESQGKVFLGEHELARGMYAYVLGQMRRGR